MHISFTKILPVPTYIGTYSTYSDYYRVLEVIDATMDNAQSQAGQAAVLDLEKVSFINIFFFFLFFCPTAIPGSQWLELL